MGLGLIWYAALDLQHTFLRIAYLKSHFSWFWDFSVFDMLLIVLGLVSIVSWYLFNVSAIFEATKKMRNEKPCKMVAEFRLDLPCGPDLWQKRCHASHIAQSSLPLGAWGIQASCFHWFSLVFIDFRRIWGYLGRAACGGLWRTVAACGGIMLALLECCKQ